jgi:colanic acid/amylovoran biosynthesis glycosyltransferase
MSPDGRARDARVGYVLKRYPRYSETFVVNEILAHEAAGAELEIFALRPPNDTHFQNSISRVRAPVTYLPSEGVKAADLWAALEALGAEAPRAWPALAGASGASAIEVYQAALLARAARRRGITHLHAHFATTAACVARLAARFGGLTYTFTAHAKDIFHEEVDPTDLARKLRDAAGVVTVSDYNLRHLRATYGPSAARVERVYNGLDLAEFNYLPPRERPARVASVGRLVEKKGFGVLIEACARLARDGRRFECVVAGAGELEAELREQVARLGLGASVRLVGPRPQGEVVRLIQSSAAFAAPCVVGADGNRDGLPTVLLEAMASGTPCVSTDVTGIPEILRDGETGLMVAQHDPPALARALARLLDDADLRVRLAEGARRLVEAEFDIKRNAARVRELFRRAAREHAPATAAESRSPAVLSAAGLFAGRGLPAEGVA